MTRTATSDSPWSSLAAGGSSDQRRQRQDGDDGELGDRERAERIAPRDALERPAGRRRRPPRRRPSGRRPGRTPRPVPRRSAAGTAPTGRRAARSEPAAGPQRSPRPARSPMIGTRITDMPVRKAERDGVVHRRPGRLQGETGEEDDPEQQTVPPHAGRPAAPGQGQQQQRREHEAVGDQMEDRDLLREPSGRGRSWRPR